MKYQVKNNTEIEAVPSQYKVTWPTGEITYMPADKFEKMFEPKGKSDNDYKYWIVYKQTWKSDGGGSSAWEPADNPYANRAYIYLHEALLASEKAEKITHIPHRVSDTNKFSADRTVR